ncbi:MAG: chromate resistance protein [Spirochaetaceae bacterium]|nr:chromate resistance protein [Spirochaetaceae bacterium]
MRWITRAHVHVDRVACPWLIKRFVDSGAEFFFVAKAALAGAVPAFRSRRRLPSLTGQAASLY